MGPPSSIGPTTKSNRAQNTATEKILLGLSQFYNIFIVFSGVLIIPKMANSDSRTYCNTFLEHFWNDQQIG